MIAQPRFKHQNWYPIENGILPANDKQKVYTLLTMDKHITDFSEDTHVGYRGPIIIWKEIKYLDKVFIL